MVRGWMSRIGNEEGCSSISTRCHLQAQPTSFDHQEPRQAARMTAAGRMGERQRKSAIRQRCVSDASAHDPCKITGSGGPDQRTSAIDQRYVSDASADCARINFTSHPCRRRTFPRTRST
eukprot:1573607-Pyramimonas_sp.AAC.1